MEVKGVWGGSGGAEHKLAGRLETDADSVHAKGCETPTGPGQNQPPSPRVWGMVPPSAFALTSPTPFPESLRLLDPKIAGWGRAG